MKQFPSTIAMMSMLAMAVLLYACGGGEKPQEQAAAQTPAVSREASPATNLVGDATRGQSLYIQSCSACHGADAKGLQGLGKNLVNSEFVQQLSDAELLEYVKKGRAADDPLNTTGIPMPPKGGNPALTDQQIMDIIAYLRSIHQ